MIVDVDQAGGERALPAGPLMVIALTVDAPSEDKEC
jgi:hypothetical protein